MTLCSIALAAASLSAALPLGPMDPGLLPPPNRADEKAEVFSPRWDGNDIVAGSKRLSLREDSCITLTESGETLFTMCYGCRAYSKATGRTFWPTMTYRFGSKGKMRREGNAIVHERPFRIEDFEWSGAFRQRVELMPDGLILIEVVWTDPENDNFKFTSIGASWSVPYAMGRGYSYSVNGHAERFTAEPDKRGRFWKRGKDGMLEYSFFTDHSARQFRMFSLDGETGPSASMFSLAGGINFRMAEKTDGRRRGYRVYLDIRRGVAARRGDDVRGGVDFRMVENMGMPDTGTRNLLPNPSFERGMLGLHRRGDVGYEYYPERWKFPVWTADDSERWHGAKSLKILAWNKGGVDYRNLDTTGGITLHQVACEAGPHTISFYAKGNRPGNLRLAVWVGNFSTGSNYSPVTGYNKRLVVNPGAEWKRYSYTYDIPVSMPVAIRVTANSLKEPYDGAVWIDAVQLEKGSEATDFVPPPAEAELVTSSPDDFISAKEPIAARLAVSAAPGAKGSARVIVRDFFGAERFDRVFPFAADASGRAEITPDFDGAGLGLGVFAVETRYEMADGSKAREYDRFAVCEWLENRHPRRFLCAEDYGKPAGRENVLHQLDRWKKVGIGMKASVGVADCPEAYQLYASNGIPIEATIWVTRYTDTNGVNRWCCQLKKRRGSHFRNEAARPETLFADPWLDPDCPDNVPTEKYLAKVRDAGARIAREYPFIDRWQFGSEFFGTYAIEYWSPDGDEKKAHLNHAKILKAFGEGIKSVSPDKKYAGDDPWNMNSGQGVKEVEMTLTAAKELGWKFDFVTCHSYRRRPEAPDTDADLAEIMAVLERLGYKDVPFELPEGMHWGPYEIPQWGTVSASWSGTPATWGNGPLTYDIGWTEKVSASWYARSWIAALKHNVHAFCASMCNGGNFALESDRLTPRAAQLVSNAIGHQLGYAKCLIADIRFAPLMRAYVFDDGFDRPVAAIWGCDPAVDAGRKAPAMAEVDMGGTLERVTDMMNNSRPIPSAGVFSFPLAPFPLFLRGRAGSADAFVAALRKARVVSGDVGPCATLEARLADARTARVRVRNLLGGRLEGMLNGRGVSVEVQGETTVSMPIREGVAPSAISRVELPIELDSARDGRVKCDLSFSALSARRTVYDGEDPSGVDWASVPKVELKPWGEVPAGYGGTAQTAWNGKGIFLRVEVRDAKFVHEEYAVGARRNANDCLQIGFDGYCDGHSTSMDGLGQDDYEYAVFPNAGGDGAVMWANSLADRQITNYTKEHGNCLMPSMHPKFERIGSTGVYLVFFSAKRIFPSKVEKGGVVAMGLTVHNVDDASASGTARVGGGLSFTGENGVGRPRRWVQILLEDAQ